MTDMIVVLPTIESGGPIGINVRNIVSFGASDDLPNVCWLRMIGDTRDEKVTGVDMSFEALCERLGADATYSP